MPSLCLCFFTILMRNVLILKTFCVHQRGKRPFDTHIIVLHVQMNEFPEVHVKVPSWELFILHIAVRF